MTARIRAHLDTCAHCRDLYTFEGAFLRTVAELLDAPADDTASLRSRIIHALAEGRIKRSVASTLISGIKVCSRLVSELIEEGLLKPEEPELAESTKTPASPEPRLVPQMAAARSSSPSSSNKAPVAFRASHRPSAKPDIDSSTQRMIRELLAQSQQMAVKHAPRA